MGKMTEERFDALMKMLGLEHGLGWSLISGVLTNYIDRKTDDISTIARKIDDLWDNHNRLLEYLGLEDVTIPPKNKIRKIRKAKPKSKGAK